MQHVVTLFDLYETGIGLWLSSVKRTMRPSCGDLSALLANVASICAVFFNELLSRIGIRMDAL